MTHRYSFELMTFSGLSLHHSMPDSIGVLQCAKPHSRLVSTPSAQPCAARLGILRDLSPPFPEFFRFFSASNILLLLVSNIYPYLVVYKSNTLYGFVVIAFILSASRNAWFVVFISSLAFTHNTPVCTHIDAHIEWIL